MPEKHVHFLFHSPAWTLISIFILGTIGRTLISDEPFRWKKFLGELTLTVVAGVTLFSFGALEGMSTPQLILAGGLGSLGGVRLVEWGIKAYRKLKVLD